MQFYTQVTDESGACMGVHHLTLFAAQCLMEFFGIQIDCSDSVTLFTALGKPGYG